MLLFQPVKNYGNWLLINKVVSIQGRNDTTDAEPGEVKSGRYTPQASSIRSKSFLYRANKAVLTDC